MILTAVGGVSAEEAAATEWPATPLRMRLRVLKQARLEIAARASEFVDAIPAALGRNAADTLAAEVLPLLEAARFLEREAARILRPRHLGRRGLPFWLAGLSSTVERVPLGRVLVIGPSNYPLLLAGVQVLQALAAGNTVVWKPGLGGRAVALIFATALQRAGLPAGALQVTGESLEDGVQAMQSVGGSAPFDKVFFTGSGASGRAVLRVAAETATPVVAELSGCDAVVVLPSADPTRVIGALSLGMRLNRSQTCMAPRRLMLVGRGHEALIAALRERFAAMEAVDVREGMRVHVRMLVDDAVAAGATLLGDPAAARIKPLLLLGGRPEMRITQADIFAPVLTAMEFRDAEEMLRAEQACPFGLTATIFGDEREALALGRKMKVGALLVNDLMVPTVDPRVPFGGRRGSGFGSTRGAEGLLEMTAVRTVQVRRGRDMRHFQPTGEPHEEMFRGVIAMGHGKGFAERFAGLRRMIGGARRMK